MVLLLADDYAALQAAIQREEANQASRSAQKAEPPLQGDENVPDLNAQIARDFTARNGTTLLKKLLSYQRNAVIVEEPAQKEVVAIGSHVYYRDSRFSGEVFYVLICGEWHDPIEDTSDAKPLKLDSDTPIVAKTLMGMKVGETRPFFMERRGMPSEPPAEITVERID